MKPTKRLERHCGRECILDSIPKACLRAEGMSSSDWLSAWLGGLSFRRTDAKAGALAAAPTPRACLPTGFTETTQFLRQSRPDKHRNHGAQCGSEETEGDEVSARIRPTCRQGQGEHGLDEEVDRRQDRVHGRRRRHFDRDDLQLARRAQIRQYNHLHDH